MNDFNFLSCFAFPFRIIRGISSTVRRCIEKESGREFAAKIIDLGAESGDVSSAQMLEATRQEIAILRQVMGHPYISKCVFTLRCVISNRNLCVFLLSFAKLKGKFADRCDFFLFITVELQDVFESDAFIFLVFELCRNGELFDYLTSVVTLSEKKTRYIMR